MCVCVCCTAGGPWRTRVSLPRVWWQQIWHDGFARRVGMRKTDRDEWWMSEQTRKSEKDVSVTLNLFKCVCQGMRIASRQMDVEVLVCVFKLSYGLWGSATDWGEGRSWSARCFRSTNALWECVWKWLSQIYSRSLIRGTEQMAHVHGLYASCLIVHAFWNRFYLVSYC